MVFQRTSPLIADPNPIEAVSVVSVITPLRASGLMTPSPSGRDNKITSPGTRDNCCNALLYLSFALLFGSVKEPKKSLCVSVCLSVRHKVL